MTDSNKQECGRCGGMFELLHPLDGVAHPHTGAVCDDCVKPWDEVVGV